MGKIIHMSGADVMGLGLCQWTSGDETNRCFIVHSSVSGLIETSLEACRHIRFSSGTKSIVLARYPEKLSGCVRTRGNYGLCVG